MVDGFMNANQSQFLWTYIVSARREVFHPTELSRHWGMVCPCPEHVQERHDGAKRQMCWNNSRRLRGAWGHAKIEMDAAQQRSTTISELDTEGNHLCCKVLRDQLKAKSSGIRMRCKYLSRVPWLFVKMDEQESATEIMRQVRSLPLEQHDPLTQTVIRRLGGAIERVAEGEEPSPELLAEQELFDLCPLDESIGEGYHAGTSNEKRRAHAAKKQPP